MLSTESGRGAEQRAAEYLAANGYRIVETNWKRPYAEIDIIASKADVTYFVEVKYRASDRFGSGLEYIAANKLRHMRRAADAWCAESGYTGLRQLAAIEVSGADYTVTSFIENAF